MRSRPWAAQPADLVRGVDALCLGGTKNGALAAEAVVFLDPAHARDFDYRRQRSGHVWSKQRIWPRRCWH
ncbi:hypothetical protein [Paracoccus mutanolyticus]|uniref:hypothetical protein n=1 Tax=Paracoccus mutanolyticus TaxID=1499308 RepID=UPI001CB8CC68|nr:hypothetical protein [Paracoccus mutanolyticus]